MVGPQGMAVKDVAVTEGKGEYMRRRYFFGHGSRVFVVLGMIALLAFSAGCVTGPVRYKTLGRYNYATVEFTKRTPSFGKPLAAAGGVISDGTILVADTLLVPMVSIPVAVKAAALGPSPETRDFGGHPIRETILSVLTFPIYLPWSYGLSLYFQSYAGEGTPYFERFYPGMYGDESTLFVNPPVSDVGVTPEGAERP